MQEQAQWKKLLDGLEAEFRFVDNELNLLHEIDLQILSNQSNLPAVLGFIARGVATLVGADHVQMMLQRGEWLETTYSVADVDSGQRVSIQKSITGRCFTTNEVVLTGDTTQPPYDDLYVPILGKSDQTMYSEIVVPIRIGEVPVGVLNAESQRRDAFSHQHADAMVKVAAQAAVALQRLQLFDTEELFRKLDQILLDVDESEFTDVLQAALEEVVDTLRQQHIELTGAQILFKRNDEELEIVYSTSPADVGLRVPIQQSICGRAVRERRTVVVGKVDDDPEYRRMLGSTIQSEIAVPIRMGGDQSLVIGVLNVESEERDAFTGFYDVVLTNFAGKVRTLLAFTKLRRDVTDVFEVRSANDLLIAIGDQTSNMIHRLNNTVGAMRFRIRQLQDLQEADQLSDDRVRDTLASLLDLADRTLRMPQEVTSFFGQSNTVDVNECVRRIVGDLQIPPFVSVELNLGENVTSLPLYSFDIVVQNLVRNAIDAMPNGGTLTVSTSVVSHHDLASRYLELVVRDTGSGMSAEVLDRIFELNFTTKREKEGKGLGFGMWWVRAFIKRAHGDIAIYSEVGAGTEVIVKIPFEGVAIRRREPDAN
jgi:signal transduction histidine kinase